MTGKPVWVAVMALMAMVHQPALAKPVPEGTYALCRTLERSLRGGEVLTVERCWEIRFTAAGTGTAVDGTQSGVRVQAPPALAPLAAVEEQRVEDGIFPVTVSADGLLSPNSGARAAPALADAGRAALDVIATIEADPEAADMMGSFVRQVSAAASQYLGQVPRDLFYPAIRSDRQEIALDLPGGAKGSVVIEQTATTTGADGLLAEARRSIVTRTGETERSSVETWVLERTKP